MPSIHNNNNNNCSVFAFWGLSVSGRVLCSRLNTREPEARDVYPIIDVKFVWNVVKLNLCEWLFQPVLLFSHVRPPATSWNYSCDSAFVDTWQANRPFLSAKPFFVRISFLLNSIQCVIWYNCCSNNGWIDVIIIIAICRQHHTCSNPFVLRTMDKICNGNNNARNQIAITNLQQVGNSRP